MGTLEGILASPVCTWESQSVACVPDTTKRGTSVVVGGIEQIISTTLFIRVAAIPGGTKAPTAGAKIIYDSKTYRIISVDKVPGGSHYEVDCADANK